MKINHLIITNNLGLIEIVDSLLHSAGIARQIIMSVKMDDPAKLLYAAKQLAREAAIGKF